MSKTVINITHYADGTAMPEGWSMSYRVEEDADHGLYRIHAPREVYQIAPRTFPEYRYRRPAEDIIRQMSQKIVKAPTRVEVVKSRGVPVPLAAGAAALTLIVGALCGGIMSRATTEPEYIPTTPAVCLGALETADDLFEGYHDSFEEVTGAMTNRVPNRAQVFKDASTLVERLSSDYSEAANQCRTAARQ